MCLCEQLGMIHQRPTNGVSSEKEEQAQKPKSEYHQALMSVHDTVASSDEGDSSTSPGELCTTQMINSPLVDEWLDTIISL